MKKTLFTNILILSLFLLSYRVIAQSEEAASAADASSSATTQVGDTVKAFRERTEKALEAERSNQQVLAGNVKSIKDNKITLIARDNEEYTITIEKDLTLIYSLINGVKKEKEFDDIVKDDYIVVTGPMIDKNVNANSIYLEEQYILQSGKVTDINREDFYLNILNVDKENDLVDIEIYTKIYLINIKTLESERIGFSKIKVGDTIHIVYKKSIGDKKEEQRYSATRILVIPQEYFVKK